MRWLSLISVAIFTVWLYFANPFRILSLNVSVELVFVAIAAVATLCYIVIRITRWKAFLKFLGVGVSYTDASASYISGLFLSLLTPGRIAEPIRGVLLKTKTGTRLSLTLPVIIVERVMDLIVVLLMSALCIFSIGGVLAGISIFIDIAVVASACIIIFTAVILTNEKVFKKTARILFKMFRVESKLLPNFVADFFATTKKMSRASFFAVFFFTVAAWVMESVVLALILKALGMYVGFAAIFGIVGLTQLVGLVSALPGGLGSMEAVMSILLLSQIPATHAAAATLMYRILTLCIVLAIGLVTTVKFFGTKYYSIGGFCCKEQKQSIA